MSALIKSSPRLSHLDRLESEAIHIIREAAGERTRLALLFSGGKDSATVLHLARKAFWPEKLPFPLLHVDTGHNFPEVLEFRDAEARRHGERLIVRQVEDSIVRGTVKLAKGGELSYDRLVLSPGVDFLWDQIPGLAKADAQARILHAWKAGPQTVALRQQLESMADGGVYALSIPKAPYRCPPGPYERACLVASYFKQHKPRSKVIVLDANEEVVSKKGLFIKAWDDLYKGIVEYRHNSEVKDVDAGSATAILEFDKCKADVLNVVPPQRAADLAARTGLKLINNRWVDINWLTMESANTPGIHVLGDAIFPAPTMPKSGHMANQHAKLAAAAIINLLAGQEPNPAPVVMNTCYSFVDPKNVIHVASVHQYDPATRLVQPVKGAGGVSAARNEVEGKVALGWAKNIWADMLG